MKTKSENALRTIGEISEIVEVPAHVIRFWETKFYQIKPIKIHNRRYYNLNNIILLKKIKHFLYEEKLSISEAVDILKKDQKDNLPKQLSLFEAYNDNPPIKTSSDDLSLIETKSRLIQARNRLNILLQK